MSKAGNKPSATPKKKTNRDKVNDEIIKIKRKNSGGNKLPLILAIVGVLLLAVVGGLIFILQGDDNTTPLPRTPKGGNRVANNTGTGDVPPADAPAPGDAEAQAKLAQLLNRLDDEKERAGAIKELGDKLKTGGEPAVKHIIKELTAKAKAGNTAARDLLREAITYAESPLAQTLAQRSMEELGESVAAGSIARVDPTNMLPLDSQTVFVVSVKRLLSSGFERGIFTFGAFRFADFETRLGILLGNIEKLAIGANKEHGHALVVVRTVDPFDWEEVKVRLHVDATEQKSVKGKGYFMGKADFLGEFLGEPMPALAGLKKQAAVAKLDSHTLVFGDEASVKDLLDNPPAAPAPQIAAAPGTAPSATAPQASAPSTSSRGGGGTGQMLVEDAPPVPAGGGTPGGTAADGTTPGQPSATVQLPKRYQRLDGRLRQVMEAAEDGKEPLGLFADSSIAGRLGKTRSAAGSFIFLGEMPAPQLNQIEILAVALPPIEGAAGNPTLRAVLLCKDRRESETVRAEVSKALTRGRERLKDWFGFSFQIGEGTVSDNPVTTNTGANAPGSGQANVAAGNNPYAGMSMSGTAGGNAPPPQTAPPPPPQGTPPPAPPTGRGRGSGGAGASMGEMRAPGAPAGGFNQGAPGSGLPGSDPLQPETKAEDKSPRGHVEISRADELVIIMVTIYNRRDDFFEGPFGNLMVKLRGDSELASGRLRVGDLSKGATQFRNSLSAAGENFVSPLGIARRSAAPGRGNRPYPAGECVSWMPNLLPYLPGDRYQTLAAELDSTLSWRDPKNIAVGRVVVSPFLNSQGRSYVRVRGSEQPLAVTDFVGMAGVGPDAAYYDKSDRRAGIFGYYRQTKLEDIKDGTANTIYMIQSDSSVTGPWIAGGGSTIRGTSTNGDRDVGFPGGFSSPNFKNKPGVWILMADGSARFLTKDVSPEVFKALCTMNGGDNAGELDLLAPQEKLESTPFTPAQLQNTGKPATGSRRPRSTIKDDD